MEHLPEFESSFLSEIAKSFSKVRKSIKYDSRDLKFNKVMDIVDERKAEKIEISIGSSLSRDGIRIRFYAWDDRWLWIDARKSQKTDWEWEYSIEGRMSGAASERQLMEALKSFNKDTYIFHSENVIQEANLHWNKLIATGPKAIGISE